MIKYLGSKRRLVSLIGELYSLSGATTAADFFAGTTRVGQEFKRRGAYVHSVDYTAYSDVFARCYIASDRKAIDMPRLELALQNLGALPGQDGYFVDQFCREARYFTPENGAKINAMWEYLIAHRELPYWPILMTSLIEAADRVDSTVGVQMAYLKKWAARALQPINLRIPEMLNGSGEGHHLRMPEQIDEVPRVDFAYFDPPYNQHSYVGNYHIWETMARGDKPETYGVARKRIDIRDKSTGSPFNRKNEIKEALRNTVQGAKADFRLVSYSDDTWLSLDDLLEITGPDSIALAVSQRRYIGAKIGIFNPSGEKVGVPGKERNNELLVLSGSNTWTGKVREIYADILVTP